MSDPTFACPRIPSPRSVTFGDLEVGEEFCWPGDPYEDIWRKLTPLLACREGERPTPILAHEKVVRV